MTGPSPSDRRGERGVTAVEAVISLALLGFLAGALTVTGPGDLRFLRESQEEALALRACAARLEAFVSGREVPAEGERAIPLPGPLAASLGKARGEETVRAAGDGLREVAVVVRWTTPWGGERSARLVTLVAGEGGR